MPINYTVPLLITTKDIQEDYDFQLTDIESIEDLLLIMERIKMEDKEVTLLGPERLITSFFLDKDMAFYNLKSKEVNVRSTGFSQAVEEYIQLKSYSDKDPTSYDQVNIFNGLFNKDIIFYNSEYGKVLDLMQLDAYLKAKGQKGIDFIAFPQPEGAANRLVAPFLCMAINNSSENKEEAYNFIKMATNKGYQLNNSLPFLPINQEAFKGQLKNNIEKGKNRLLLRFNCNIRSLSPELQQRYEDIVDSVTRSQWLNTDIYMELDKSIEKYEKGEATLEGALEELEAKITLYLNE